MELCRSFSSRLHGFRGKLRPVHAYYNGSCTSKYNEDPSWSTSFKTRRTQKTSTALEVLWKTLFMLYLYMIGTFHFNVVVPGVMTYLMASLTLDRARPCVMQIAFHTPGMVSSIPTVFSRGGSISLEGFLPSILLLVVIIIAVAVVVTVVVVVVSEGSSIIKHLFVIIDSLHRIML
ncbi:hypothetical protein Tco_0858543 [Tanacetum coccineum]|uniref:Uncharacterized protein n=1 Tax=Tanacetum coccineum TaxID=301880 RepID=A0ABQ5BA61_9ASTR